MASFRALIEAAQSHMDPGEAPEAAILGAYVTHRLGRKSVRRGVLIATDRRVVFYAKGVGGYAFEAFPYASISSIRKGKGLLGAHVTIHAGGDRAYMKRIRKGAINRFTETVAALIGRAEPPAAPAPDFVEQIEKLGALRDRGLMSEAEFEAKKAEILARI